jgi:hypothetical protein
MNNYFTIISHFSQNSTFCKYLNKYAETLIFSCFFISKFFLISAANEKGKITSEHVKRRPTGTEIILKMCIPGIISINHIF